jgi:hypothetical protein
VILSLIGKDAEIRAQRYNFPEALPDQNQD